MKAGQLTQKLLNTLLHDPSRDHSSSVTFNRTFHCMKRWQCWSDMDGNKAGLYEVGLLQKRGGGG